MANPRPTWQQFYEEGLGPLLPLTSGQKVQTVSGVLPSGEAGFLDFEQLGSGINDSYPNPYNPSGIHSSGWWEVSGIFKTYPPEDCTPVDSGRESGVFHFNELLSQFSNANDSAVDQIEDFTIFNPYIHHETLPTTFRRNRNAISISYISTYNTVIEFNPYNSGIWTGFGTIPINTLLP